MATNWLDHIAEAPTEEQRMARVEEWVDQRHGDLGLDYEPPRYEPPWKRVLWGTLLVIVWAGILAGIIFGG